MVASNEAGSSLHFLIEMNDMRCMHMHMHAHLYLALPDRDERDEREAPAAYSLQPGPAVCLDQGNQHLLEAVDLRVCAHMCVCVYTCIYIKTVER